MKPEEHARENIDKLLTLAGWKVVERKTSLGSHKEAIKEYPTSSGPADYLLTLNGQPIATVEAKKQNTPVDGVLTQALRYAQDLEGTEAKWGQYKVPFVYSSDGNDIRFQNLFESVSFSRKVEGFHTPDALEEMLSADKANALVQLKSEQVRTDYGGRQLREYQKEAVEFVVDTLVNRKRKTLVAMATGTGKTFMASALIYHLMKIGYFKRVLFLVDRRSLADQTITALSTFEPEKGNKFDSIYSVYCDRIPTDEETKSIKYNAKILQPSLLKSRQNANTFVYVSTIQRLYSMLKGKEYVEPKSEDEWSDGDDSPIGYNSDFPIDSFDLIISDECHRSIYNKWKYVLEYFDSNQVGLTATPALHTAAFFDCNKPEDMYTYGYQKAIDEGYLVDFDAVRIKTDIDMDEEVTLTKGEAIMVKDVSTGYLTNKLLEDELNIDTSSLERKVTIEDRNRKIVNEVLSYIDDKQKTIVFAVNDNHADQLVRLFRQSLNKGDDYVQKITYSIDKPSELIRTFRNLEKPSIVVTVDMLSTGVDIPRVENLVIVKPIRSRILYEQIIGRGTRLCPEINKTHFTVFDTVGVIEFMKTNGGNVMQPTGTSEKTIGEIISDIKKDNDIDRNIQTLRRKLKRISRNITEDGKKTLENDYGVTSGDIGTFSDTIQDRLAQKEEKIIELFGDAKFQEFLTNYPRYREGFIISKEKRATISISDYIFRTTDGRELKPQDYLESFKLYIKRNANEIEALKILLNEPRKFTMKEFNELKQKLAETPERYTEHRLQQAAEIVEHTKTPADLYSFVAHAVWDKELITPKRRVDRAFGKLKLTVTNDSQEHWLRDIKSHLETNIIIEQDDFKSLPFSRRGGFGKANQDFGGNLNYLIEDINKNILEG